MRPNIHCRSEKCATVDSDDITGKAGESYTQALLPASCESDSTGMGGGEGGSHSLVQGYSTGKGEGGTQTTPPTPIPLSCAVAFARSR